MSWIAMDNSCLNIILIEIRAPYKKAQKAYLFWIAKTDMLYLLSHKCGFAVWLPSPSILDSVLRKELIYDLLYNGFHDSSRGFINILCKSVSPQNTMKTKTKRKRRWLLIHCSRSNEVRHFRIASAGTPFPKTNITQGKPNVKFFWKIRKQKERR